MNTAQMFNEDGQRILPERLYSPFVRLPPVIKRRVVHQFVRATKGDWIKTIHDLLGDGKQLTITEIYTMAENGHRSGLEKAMERLKAKGIVVASGKKPGVIYRLAK